MSVCIYDLAREAELLKSNISRQQSGDSDVWSCRQRLEDVYRQMILLDLDLALEKRVEADLWNFVFKTQINSLLTDITQQQGVQKDESQASLSLFLESASCFYYQLLHSLCCRHRVSLPSFLSKEQIGVSRGAPTADSGTDGTVRGARVRVWCQDCLLRMGDVARYKGECDIASKYYHQADELLPGKGHISNQLGLVASTEGNFFSAAFHYSHAILSRSPFLPSRSNLEQLFETHARHFPDEITDMSSFQTGFLHLVSLIHLSRDLSPFCLLLSQLHAPLSSLLLDPPDVSHQFMLSLVGHCLFACTTCFQPLTKISLAQAAECLTPEEHQKYELSLRLLLETTSVLTACSISLPLHDLSTILPFISVSLHWVRSHMRHITLEQLTQVPELWTDTASLLDKLSIKPGLELSMDIDQPLNEELALIAFIHPRQQTSYTRGTCTIEDLCLGKIINSIKQIIKEKLSAIQLLTVINGVYKLSFTPPPTTKLSQSPPPTQGEHSPLLSPLSARTPPASSSSADYTFFPGIWSNNPDEQTTPEALLPSVTSADNIKSLWNNSDISSS